MCQEKITGKLEKWRVVSYDPTKNPYQPPESILVFLNGCVYNHSKFEDGKNIATSLIKKVDGNLITTSNGSVYELGEPHPEYVEWCELVGCHVPTKEEPIKIKYE